MSHSLHYVRILFFTLSLAFFSIYTISHPIEGYEPVGGVAGLILGSLFALFFMSLEFILSKLGVRTFLTIAFGLFLGYLLSTTLFSLLEAFGITSSMVMNLETALFIKSSIYLSAFFLGLMIVYRAFDELILTSPFIKLRNVGKYSKRDFLVDPSCLLDSRIIEFASSGILDRLLIAPKYLLKEMHQMSESSDESLRLKGKKGLEVLKKLEGLSHLDLRYVDVDFPEIHDSNTKLLKIAKVLESNVLTADSTRAQPQSVDGIRVVNLHVLSNILKPVTQAGEVLNIKIQRYGKEPRQGVGYLDDGTMVVVNGGAEFIGSSLRAQVLSVKHTSSGRMIFCNVAEGSYGHDAPTPSLHSISPVDIESSHVNYRVYEPT